MPIGTRQSKRQEIPMNVTIRLEQNPNEMADADLAYLIRCAYDRRHDARKAAYDKVSADQGHAVTINGVEYPSKSRAMKALGWSFDKLTRVLAEQKS